MTSLTVELYFRAFRPSPAVGPSPCLVVCLMRGERRGDLRAVNEKMRLGLFSSVQLMSDEEELISLLIFSSSLAKVTFLSCLDGDGASDVSEVSRTNTW